MSSGPWPARPVFFVGNLMSPFFTGTTSSGTVARGSKRFQPFHGAYREVYPRLPGGLQSATEDPLLPRKSMQ